MLVGYQVSILITVIIVRTMEKTFSGYEFLLDQNLFHSCVQENISRAIAGCSPSCLCPTEWVPGFVLHGAQKLHAQTSSSCQDDSNKK